MSGLKDRDRERDRKRERRRNRNEVIDLNVIINPAFIIMNLSVVAERENVWVVQKDFEIENSRTV